MFLDYNNTVLDYNNNPFWLNLVNSMFQNKSVDSTLQFRENGETSLNQNLYKLKTSEILIWFSSDTPVFPTF